MQSVLLREVNKSGFVSPYEDKIHPLDQHPEVVVHEIERLYILTRPMRIKEHPR